MKARTTPQGRAALINPPNNGTTMREVVSIGITATAFDADLVTQLPDEIKRVTAISGTVVSDDTISVTMVDTTADTYIVRGLCLYLDTGEELAIVGDANASNSILQKAGAARTLLTINIKLVDVSTANITFGDVSFSNPPASSTVAGVVRFATSQQHIDGTAQDLAANPFGLRSLLDHRFGEGAPTALMRGLLQRASAELVRSDLGIKSVATLTMGANGGIDADMVDGKHASEFAQAGHTHGISDVLYLQLALDNKAPVLHGHSISSVNNLQSALDAKANLAGAAFTGTISAPMINGVTAPSSSLRYKCDVVDIDPDVALELLQAIRFVDYIMRDSGLPSSGVIAEWLAEGPFDHLVIRDENGRPDSVNYHPLFTLACAAVVGLGARVRALEAR